MPLEAVRVLVVEDDFVIAHDLAESLSSRGADVIGPAASVAEAMDLVTRGDPVHLAVLKVNLRRATVHPILAVLRRQDVPCLLLTAHTEASDDPRLAGIPLVARPAAADAVSQRLAALWHATCRAVPD